MPEFRIRALALAGALVVAAASGGEAQIKASPLGSVSQTIDGTTLTVEYSRPSARGRDLVGGLVDWGYMWTPGANWATTLVTDGPIHLAGQLLPAGEYSVWMQAQPDEWAVHLHPNPRLFHTGEYPEAEEFQITVPVAPSQADHYAEVLTFGFPEVAPNGGLLRMHWGDTAIDLPFEVQPSVLAFEMTAEEMAPFVGAYSGHVNMAGEQPMALTIEAVDGHLEATIGQWGDAKLMLIPTASPDRFRVAWLRDGAIFNVEDEPAVFHREGSEVTRLVVIGIRNQPWFELEKTD